MFFSYNNYAQVKTKFVTKLFFEEGFKNCKVKVLDKNKYLFSGSLTTPRDGAAKIIEINKPDCLKITISACGKTKVLKLKKTKFYRISIIENLLIVKEVDEEPLYV